MSITINVVTTSEGLKTPCGVILDASGTVSSHLNGSNANEVRWGMKKDSTVRYQHLSSGNPYSLIYDSDLPGLGQQAFMVATENDGGRVYMELDCSAGLGWYDVGARTISSGGYPAYGLGVLTADESNITAYVPIDKPALQLSYHWDITGFEPYDNKQQRHGYVGEDIPVTGLRGPIVAGVVNGSSLSYTLTVYDHANGESATFSDTLTFDTDWSSAANIYISNTGNDTTGDGSSGSPYRTWKKGVDTLLASNAPAGGRILNVPYGFTDTMTAAVTRRTPVGPFLIRANGGSGAKPSISTNGFTALETGSGTSDLRLVNIEFVGTNSQSYKNINVASSECLIWKCKSELSNYSADLEGEDLVVADSEFYDGREYSLFSMGSPERRGFVGNYIRFLGTPGFRTSVVTSRITPHHACFLFNWFDSKPQVDYYTPPDPKPTQGGNALRFACDNSATCEYVNVWGNKISFTEGDGGEHNLGNGNPIFRLTFQYGTTPSLNHLLVEGNSFEAPAASDQFYQAFAPQLAEGYLRTVHLRNNYCVGPGCFIDVTRCEDLWAYHNTHISRCGVSGNSYFVRNGGSPNAVNRSQIFNNMADLRTNSAGGGRFVSLGYAGNNPAYIAIFGNAFYSGASSSIAVGSSTYTLTSWQNLKHSNPYYTSEFNTNNSAWMDFDAAYKLVETADAVDYGLPGWTKEDYWGNPRDDSRPDPGASEYTPVDEVNPFFVGGTFTVVTPTVSFDDIETTTSPVVGTLSVVTPVWVGFAAQEVEEPGMDFSVIAPTLESAYGGTVGDIPVAVWEIPVPVVGGGTNPLDTFIVPVIGTTIGLWTVAGDLGGRGRIVLGVQQRRTGTGRTGGDREHTNYAPPSTPKLYVPPKTLVEYVEPHIRERRQMAKRVARTKRERK